MATGNKQHHTQNNMAALNVKQTKVYKLAFEQAMEIFELSKKFPKEETYSLTDQIRRSSRSACICLIEAYRKKRYPAHFVSKVTDSDMENSETSGWLDFALACKYIDEGLHAKYLSRNEEIGRLLNHMINNPEKY
ncbi:MAG TPA: four helix bundle protein [Chitinophagaceae bacterium]